MILMAFQIFQRVSQKLLEDQDLTEENKMKRKMKNLTKGTLESEARVMVN